MASGNTLEVEVLTPEGEVFSGEVRQVSTRTVGGEIGILANHVPILAALEPAELRLHISEQEIKRYAQAHGWLQVFGNKAQLLVEEAIDPANLDVSELRERIAADEKELDSVEKGSAAATRVAKDLQRSKAFLKIAEG